MSARELDEAYQGYLDRGRAAHARRATAETGRHGAIVDECPQEQRVEVMPIRIAPYNQPMPAGKLPRLPLWRRALGIFDPCTWFVIFAALALVLVALDVPFRLGCFFGYLTH